MFIKGYLLHLMKIHSNQLLVQLTETKWMCRASDTHGAFDIFHNQLVALFNKHSPKVKVKRKYNNRKPWLSEALKNSMKYNNKLYWKSKQVK